MRSVRGGRHDPDGTPVVPWLLRSGSRLFGALFLVLALPLAAFTVVLALDAKRSFEAQAIRLNTAAARLGAEAVVAHFEDLTHYVESYARRPALSAAIRADLAEDVRSQLSDLVEGHARIDRAFIADLDGVERYDWPQDPSLIGASFALRDWYKGVAATGRTYVSEVYLRAALPPLYIVSVATPVAASRESPLGYLVVQHSVAALTERLATFRPGDVGGITLVDQQGRLAVEGTEAESGPPDLGEDPLLQRLFAGGEISAAARDPRSGEPSLISRAPVPTIGWVVLAHQPEAIVLAPARSLQRAIVWLSVLFLAVTLGLGYLCLSVVRRYQRSLVEIQGMKDFLSGMVLHDLRSPLAATLLSIDLVSARAEGLDVKGREDLARAGVSARRLLELTNTLLDVMRMEEGALQLDLAPHDLRAFVETHVEEYQLLARAASVSLERVVPSAPVESVVDVRALGRVLDNLLDNAIKHTPPGGRVEVRLEPETAAAGGAFVVSDTGEGIPAVYLPRLFQKYARIPAGKLRLDGGAGLGLVFCRMVVELHGGTISVGSEPSRGSSFRVLLPKRGARRAPDVTPSGARGPPRSLPT